MLFYVIFLKSNIFINDFLYNKFIYIKNFKIQTIYIGFLL